MKNEVSNLIYTVRESQVMLDSDLAELFEVETKVFNQAVKRNINRFPDSFRFQLSKEEYDVLKVQIASSGDASESLKNRTEDTHILRSQNVTIEIDVLKSQNVTLKQGQGKHRKYLPYVYAEQGVAMLTGILRSDVAVQMSIRIMIAFVEMRKIISTNTLINSRLETIESRQFAYKNESDKKFEQLFNAMQDNEVEREKIFFNGQIYDAYSFIIKLIEKAHHEIILINNYVDNSVLDMMSKKKLKVTVMIVTLPDSRIKNTDVQKFNLQYPTLKLKHSNQWHDRFLLIDKTELYHIGASLKDLGKKCFAFSKIENMEIVTRLIAKL